VSDALQERLDAQPELDYLTHIVFRMYENVKVRPWAAQWPCPSMASRSAPGIC